MDFDYNSYLGLLKSLQTHGYSVCSYHDYQQYDRCVILRHDIDYSIQKSLQLARLEASRNVRSTYFVLLTSDFYNTASAGARKMLMEIQSLGHEIGLHFDETVYPEGPAEQETAQILRERKILEDILETEITVVSMHRPSRKTLDADLQIPDMINSYGSRFFHDFKYVSDSRRRWREPVEDIIASRQYKRLHILTHAFWYDQEALSLRDSLLQFISSAGHERYTALAENFTAIDEVIRKDEI